MEPSSALRSDDGVTPTERPLAASRSRPRLRSGVVNGSTGVAEPVDLDLLPDLSAEDSLA